MGISSSDFDRMERRLKRQGGRQNMEIEDRPVRRGPSEAQENARIAANRETPEAQAEHDFRLAAWADENGNGRCLVCGGRETLDADDNALACAGLAAGSDTVSDDHVVQAPDEAPDEEAPVPDGVQAEGVGEPDGEGDGERAAPREGGGELPPVADEVAGAPVEPAAAPGDAHHDGDRPGGEVTITAGYTDGVMHAHIGAGPHFHEVRKAERETGAVADGRGFELSVQHKHEIIDGVLKMDPLMAQAVPMAKPAPEPDPTETKKYSDDQARDEGGRWAGENNANTTPAGRGNLPPRAITTQPHPSVPKHMEQFRGDDKKLRQHLTTNHAFDEGTLRTLTFSHGDRLDFHGDSHPGMANVSHFHETPEAAPAKKSLSQLLGLLVPQQQIGDYRVVSKSEGPTAEEHRTTLGIVYPVGREDAHGDKMTSDEVRKAAWGWAKKGFSASGTQHLSGTGGAGVILESYLWPDSAPDWHVKRADGTEEVVKSGDWLAVVQWDTPTWADIRKGKYTGYSLQGMGKRVPEDAAP